MEARQISAGTLTRSWDEPTGVRFADGSFLHFYELVDVDQDEIVKLKYTYRFTDNEGSFTFRYDKDDIAQDGDIIKAAGGSEVWHPLCHLHFQDEEHPRYKTHEANLTEILSFIEYALENH